MHAPTTKTSQELRKFGFIMATVLGVVGGLFLWRQRSPWPYLLGLAATFLLLALVAPRALSPIERVWMKFGHMMSVVMTFVILTLTFYLVITPLGLIMRLVGRDPMTRKFDPRLGSYWVAVEPDGPCSRPDKPY